MTTGKEIVNVIHGMGAYCSGTGWISSVSHLSPRELWLSCPSADWMIYYAKKIGVAKELISAALMAVREYHSSHRKKSSPQRTAEIVREKIPYDAVRAARIAYVEARNAESSRDIPVGKTTLSESD